MFDADSRAAIALHHAGSAAQSINYAVPLSDIVASDSEGPQHEVTIAKPFAAKARITR